MNTKFRYGIKHLVWLCSCVGLFLLIGCEYDVPVVSQHTVAIDTNALGLWETQAGQKEQLVVLKYSDTEYVVVYTVGQDPPMYFKAYPIKVDGLSCIQVQLIGSSPGAVKEEERKYHVVSYRLQEGVLELKLLNTDLIDKNIRTSDALKQAILKNKDNKELFHDPSRFKRVGP